MEDEKMIGMVKHMDINKSSVTFTYRKKGDDVEVTGADVKVYGDTPEQIKITLDKLEQMALSKLSRVKEVE